MSHAFFINPAKRGIRADNTHKVKFLIVIFILIAPVIKAQSVTYKSDRIYRSFFENYNTSTQKLIDENVLGKDVTIFVDTIFNKYTIRFIDADNKKIQMVFKPTRNFFGTAANDTSELAKTVMRLYYMEMQGEENLSFLLIDYIELSEDLDILALEKDQIPFSKGRSLVYRIKFIKPNTK